MKYLSLTFCIACLLFVFSCKTSQSTTDAIYNSSWELEYVTGPRIAFDGLYPNKKPQITFSKEEGKVMGNNGCNGYSADYTLEGNKLSFGEPGPTTLMFCEGGGEVVFLKTMKKIDAYSIDADGKLNLLMGDLPMMRFKKVTP
ncbi:MULTISPECIES: META domain-containing protein [Aestuariibaculum]|uniref:META domain-containing protein n=1 Tax=Aestuariibaculum lutulentum TaxID=2920935 RepID=A0ABS9RKJ6_9FLAO|nr:MULTISPECIES: META domain-containing protein [Aestuariibaculum]MCH4553465.1 META domain-containing protein [Aestuariibaculum lutulentum]MCR8667909.1 META domain-containing protein [Aestuariibaculum sp. M13]